VKGGRLYQVDKFKGVMVAFMSDGRWNQVIDTCIGKANAVLHELYRPLVSKREFPKNVKLSVFKSVFVPILTYGHKSRLMT